MSDLTSLAFPGLNLEIKDQLICDNPRGDVLLDIFLIEPPLIVVNQLGNRVDILVVNLLSLERQKILILRLGADREKEL